MVTLLLAGIAVLCWSPPMGAVRRSGTSDSVAVRGGARPIPASVQSSAALIVVAVLGISLVGGLMVGVSALLLLGTVVLLIRSESMRRRDGHELTEMLTATRTLAREVRSGAGPAAAIIASAAAHQGTAAQVLEALAAAVAGDRGRPVDRLELRTGRGLAAEITARLARGWSLSNRYGVPWAALIETVSTDLADRVRAKSERSAQVSGPRVSGYVLAVMPGLGILLGMGMGANPLHVLLGTGVGHLMLLIGTLLTCAGLAWTARIVSG